MSSDTTTNRVRKLYEAFPYPHYPLLAPLRWQDGYLGSLDFVRKLRADQLRLDHQGLGIEYSKRQARILLAGAGEATPYIFGKFEPRKRPLISIDLSERSLRRAKTRLALTWRHKAFVRSDLNAYLDQPGTGASLDHIDSFGVLHHLEAPSKTLQLMSHALRDGGTARFMVYNTPARQWINHLQKAFRLLGFEMHQAADRDCMRNILKQLSASSPVLQKRLRNMGDATLQNQTRLIDTFLHTHEIRWDIARWFAAFNNVDLRPFAIFDRYGELDALPNPLWRAPTAAQLMEQTLAGDFSGNLEVYVQKQHGKQASCEVFIPGIQHYVTHARRGPPSLWRRYPETDMLYPMRAQRLWWQWLQAISRDKVFNFGATLPLHTEQRLARLGALLPSHRDYNNRTKLLAPMAPEDSSNEDNSSLPTINLASLQTLIDRTLSERGMSHDRRRARQILARLSAACLQIG